MRCATPPISYSAAVVPAAMAWATPPMVKASLRIAESKLIWVRPMVSSAPRDRPASATVLAAGLMPTVAAPPSSAAWIAASEAVIWAS